MSTCKAPNCTREMITHGYCSKHYTQIRKYDRLTPEREHVVNTICTFEGCSKKARARGYCMTHYTKIKQISIENGTWSKGYGAEPKFKIDIATAKILIDEYAIPQAEIARLVGTSRELIRQRLSRRSSNANWVHKSITEEEREAILELVRNSACAYTTGNIYVNIITNGHKHCIILKNGDIVKVIFEIPDDIEEVLIQNKYNIFNEIDREIYNNVKIELRQGKKCATLPTRLLKNKLRIRCKELHMTKEEYAKLLGADNILNDSFITDDEMKAILEKFSDEEKNINIPCGTNNRAPEYQRICSMAYRAGMTLQEYIKQLGYNQIIAARPRGKRKGPKNLIERIEQYRISKDSNEVYIPTAGALYKSVQRHAKDRGTTIESLLEQLGFTRVRKTGKHDRI